eukprot:5679857-Alexandrium_andersonii.AAC.1
MLLSDLATSGRARVRGGRPGLRKALFIDVRKAHLLARVRLRGRVRGLAPGGGRAGKVREA